MQDTRASPSSRVSSTDPGSEVGGLGTAALWPSLKRLPLETLGTASAKRALLNRERRERSKRRGLGESGRLVRMRLCSEEEESECAERGGCWA